MTTFADKPKGYTTRPNISKHTQIGIQLFAAFVPVGLEDAYKHLITEIYCDGFESGAREVVESNPGTNLNLNPELSETLKAA